MNVRELCEALVEWALNDPNTPVEIATNPDADCLYEIYEIIDVTYEVNNNGNWTLVINTN